jgi:hypothetical protein
MTPPRPRQPSRPDARIDPDSTPPGGSELSDELELMRAGREHPPWWAKLLFQKLSNDEQFRRLGGRVGDLEIVAHEWEDAKSNTKIEQAAVAKRRQELKDKRFDRAWQVGAPLILILILTALGWVHFGPPVQPTKIEVKP